MKIAKVSFLVVCLTFIISFTLMHNRTEKSKNIDLIDEIQRDIHLRFPTNAQLESYYYTDSIIDPIWIAKICIPFEEYEFLRNDLEKKPFNNTIHDSAITGLVHWWNPTNIVYTKQYLADNQTFVDVVVSQDNNCYSFYVECVVF